MGSTLGKHVLIENVSGGSGMIGTGRVARATADGYTVLALSASVPVVRVVCVAMFGVGNLGTYSQLATSSWRA
jgi:tripartite-type tricarboxylate transporter receptor subunit TctC